MGRFAGIVEQLDTRAVFDLITAPVLAAYHEYRPPRLVVDSYRELAETATDLYVTLMQAVRGSSDPDPGYLAEVEAMKILEQSFGGSGGLLGAFDIASGGGMSTGMDRIMQAILAGIQSHLVRNYVTHVIRRHVDPLQFEEQVEVVEEYLQCSLGATYDQAQRRRLALELAHDHEKLILRYLDHYNTLAAQGLIRRAQGAQGAQSGQGGRKKKP